MWLSDNWKEYALLDCGGGQRLERWGKQILVRPDPQAIWQPAGHPLWTKADATYHRSSSGGGVTLRAAAARELDIRGMETIEAESVVESFLSSAVMGRLETVTIIHGKGTGVLRKTVHDILRRNKKIVKDFRLGAYGEGESGVTVVTLK